MIDKKILEKRVLTFKDIIDIQNTLNEKADPNNPDWVSVRNYKDFKLSAIIEIVELIESTSWKWWKGANPADIWNLKIEMIDALHFLISNVILNGNQDNFDKILGFLDEDQVTKEFFLNDNENDGTNRNIAFDVIKSIANNDESFELINSIIKTCGLKSNEISAIYIAKYTLNEIRWEGGYAFNQYKKMKESRDENGKLVVLEDNVFLKSLVDDFDADTSLTLNDLRESVFKKLNTF